MTPLQNLLDNAILAKGMAILNRARAEPIWARKIRKVCKEFALLGALKVECEARSGLSPTSWETQEAFVAQVLR